MKRVSRFYCYLAAASMRALVHVGHIVPALTGSQTLRKPVGNCRRVVPAFPALN